jgi:hypothetical protein
MPVPINTPMPAETPSTTTITTINSI